MSPEISFIIVQHQTLKDALTTAEQLGAIIARDCWFAPESFDLKFPMDFIDLKIIEAMESTEEQAPVAETVSPTRFDRAVEPDRFQSMEQLQIETQFSQEWLAAGGDRNLERKAEAKRRQANQKLRLDIIRPMVEVDIQPGSTLIYGTLAPYSFPCIQLEQPDGRSFQVTTLIHATHPVSPEDLLVRESAVKCDRIIRYRVPGLDNGEWMRQNEPCGRLDTLGWRKLLQERQMQK